MFHCKQSWIFSMRVCALLLLISGCQPIQPVVQAPTGQAEATAVAPSPTIAATGVITETAAPASATVEIKLFQFQTPRLEIPVGTTVIWKNLDDIQHSATAGTPDSPDGLFDSDFFTFDQAFSFTFTEPGEYPYFCKRHKHMQGAIVVTR